VTLNLQHLFLLALLTSSLHWLIARSSAFKPLWSRAPYFLDGLLRCPSCSGFWLGLGMGALGARPVTGLPKPVEVLIAGLLAVWLTPVAEAVLLWGLEHSALEETPPETTRTPPPRP